MSSRWTSQGLALGTAVASAFVLLFWVVFDDLAIALPFGLGLAPAFALLLSEKTETPSQR